MENMLKPDGTKIRILRIQRGLQQQDLARIAGVRSRTVQRLEEGGNSSHKVLGSLASALEVNLDELCHGGGSARKMVAVPRTCRGRIKDGIHAIFDNCYPFLPACRMMAVSSALVMVAALAIRLSPMLVEEEGEATFGSAHLPSALVALANQSSSQAASSKSRLSREEKTKATQIAGNAIPMRMLTAPSAPMLETTPTSVPVRQQQYATHPQSSSATNYMEWLASLAESYPSTSINIGIHSQEATSLPKLQKPQLPNYVRFAPESSGTGDGDGAGIITRSIIKSGKSTAALFTKIGGSVKRAF